MSTFLKNLSLNLVALLAQFLVTKIATPSTSFAATKTAITNVALQGVADLVTAQLVKQAAAATVTTEATTTTQQ